MNPEECKYFSAENGRKNGKDCLRDPEHPSRCIHWLYNYDCENCISGINFDPMTCNINELVTYWKSYTLSEPIWNDVRKRIYEQGMVDAIDECIAKIDTLEQIAFGIVETDLVKSMLEQLKEQTK